MGVTLEMIIPNRGGKQNLHCLHYAYQCKRATYL